MTVFAISSVYGALLIPEGKANEIDWKRAFEQHEFEQFQNNRLEGSLPCIDNLTYDDFLQNLKNKSFANEVFMFAVCTGNQIMAKMALRNGADINYQDSGGDTALYYAALTRGTDLAMMEFLLKHKARADIFKFFGGLSVLHGLCNRRDTQDAIKLLIRYDANLTVRNSDWQTPAQLARECGHNHIAVILEEAQAQKKSCCVLM